MFDTHDEKWIFRHPDGREVQILRSGEDLEWDGAEDGACSGFRAESTVIPDLEEQGYVLAAHEGAPDDSAERAAAIVAAMDLPPGTDPVQPYAAAICDTLTQAGVGVEGYVLGAPELPAHRSQLWAQFHIWLEHGLYPGSTLMLGWQPSWGPTGWYHLTWWDRAGGEAEQGEALPWLPEPGVMPLPHVVTAAVRALLSHTPPPERLAPDPRWSPPADYDPAANGEDDWLPVLRNMAAYTTHPAWRDHRAHN